MKTTTTFWRVGAAALTVALSAWILQGPSLAAHGGGGSGGHGGVMHSGGGGGGSFHSAGLHSNGGVGHGEFAHGEFNHGPGQGNWNGQMGWHGNGNWNGNWHGNGNWYGNGNWNWRNRGPFVYAPFWWYPFAGYGGYGYGYGYAPYAYDYPVPYQAGYSSGVEVANQESPPQYSNAGGQPVQAFTSGDYNEAARLAQHWAVDEPQSAKPHELLSLALFATGEYRGAATEAHYALRFGPAADWPTLYGYYQDVDRYTQQARALAKYVRENPKSPEGQFLLAYQNLMMGHKKAAADGFTQVVALAPQDDIAHNMVEQLSGTNPPPKLLPPPPPNP